MKIEWKSCFRISASVFLLYLCVTYWSSVAGVIQLGMGASMPLIIGCVIAYLVNILMSFYERHYFVNTQKQYINKSRRPICMAAAFLTLIAVVFLVVWLIVPQLVSCVEVILAGVPGVLQSVVDFIGENEILPNNIIKMLKDIDWQSRIGQIIATVTTGLGSVVDIVVTAVSSIFSWIVTALLSLIFSFYLLLGKEKIGFQICKIKQRYLKKVWIRKIDYVVSILNDCFHRFIVGQCTEAVILGVLCTLGMLILNLPYATMIGALIAFTALIPIAGAYIGAIVGAFMILTVSPMKALIFLTFIIILQQLEGNIIYPRVVGSSIGLPGIWVLSAVTIGGGVMGIPGMLLGVPLVAALYRLISDDVNKNGIAKST